MSFVIFFMKYIFNFIFCNEILERFSSLMLLYVKVWGIERNINIWFNFEIFYFNYGMIFFLCVCFMIIVESFVIF